MDATTPVSPEFPPPPQPEGVLSADGKLRLYGYKNPPPQPLVPPKIVDLKPMTMSLAPGRYSWCSCGYSSRQPFCDDSHRKEEFATNRRSYKFEVLEETQLEFCMCRHTGNPPYCDNTCKSIREMAAATPTAMAATPAVAALTPVASAATLPPLKQAATALPRKVEVPPRGPYVQLGALGNVILLVGRILLSFPFLHQAFSGLTNLNAAADYIGASLPFLPEAMQGALALALGVVQLLAGLMVLFGIGTQLGAFLLILLMLPTLVFMHPFRSAGEMAIHIPLVVWLARLEMLGGLLILIAAGPGSISIDRMVRGR